MVIELMLENVKPREQAGRDALARFRAQARAAALASLSILEGKEIDRVYCDMYDDFVVRLNRSGNLSYIFYQVKTNKKKNHNWTLNEIFGLNSRIKDLSKHKNTDIFNSFAGKLLQHTVGFGNSCEAVIFQTNINIEDPIEELMTDVHGNHFLTKIASLLVERFPDCFSCTSMGVEEIKKNLKRLKFETDVQYIKLENDNFSPIAKEVIHRYSEIDLTHDEFKDILIKLMELVGSKSSGVISNINSETIESFAGISISDLLEILSISKAAFDELAAGGDPLAVKNASIIQRTLSKSGASEVHIAFCSRCKIAWDEWFRTNRHILPEIEVLTIQSDLAGMLRGIMINGQIDFSDLQKPVKDYHIKMKERLYDLDINVILGGVMAELVRMQR